MALIRFVFMAYPFKTHASLNLQGGKCWTKIVKFHVFSSGPNTWPGSGNEGFYHINDWSWPILSGWPKQIVSCHQTIVYDGATLWTRVFHGFFRGWKVDQNKYLLLELQLGYWQSSPICIAITHRQNIRRFKIGQIILKSMTCMHTNEQ